MGGMPRITVVAAAGGDGAGDGSGSTRARAPGHRTAPSPGAADTWMSSYRLPLVGFVLPLVNGDLQAAEDVVQEQCCVAGNTPRN
jgi:hypothetical protein